MNITAVIDCKWIIALGMTIVGSIFVLKMEPEAVERVSIHLIDACKECALAGNSER